MNEERPIALSFQSIVESSNDAIMLFDPSCRYLYANLAVEKYSEIPQDQFIGKTHAELGFPDELCKLWDNAICEVFQSEKPKRIEFTLPNGRIMDWYLSYNKNGNNSQGSVFASARDITDIRHSQRKSADDQVRFSDAFRLARLSTWEIDVLNKRTLLNEQFCDIIGIPYSEPYMDSDHYYQFYVYDTDKQKFMEKFREAMGSTNPDYKSILSYRINHSSGKLVWVLATIRVRMDNAGQVTHAYGTFQDITAIKQTEEELEKHKNHLEELIGQRTEELLQSENKLKDAVDLAKLSTWEYDIISERLTISGLLERKLDASRFESDNTLKIDRFVDAIFPDDFKIFYDAIQEAITTTQRGLYNILSFRMYDNQGALRHMNITVKVRFSDELNAPTCIYGTIQDITHLIESRIEKERLISIIEATTDIVLITNADLDVIYMNGAGKSFFQVDRNLSEERYPLVNILVSASESGQAGRMQSAADEGSWVGEDIIRKFDGTEVPVSQVILAHKDVTEKVDRYSITMRDLTAQKQTENDLLYKNNELDTFVYRVSHDLRGPIASLMGLYNVAKYEVSDKPALEYIEMYNNQIIRLNETIVALIDLTRIKEQEAKKEEIDFTDIVQGSIASFKHLPHFNEIEFDINVESQLQFISDKSLATTIVQNLVENAIKYARRSVRAFVKVEIGRVGGAEKSIYLRVSDNGMGIDPAIQDKIFDMFFRGTSHAMGSGLGLYILKNAVEKLNGKVYMKSQLNMGTTFTVQIPSS